MRRDPFKELNLIFGFIKGDGQGCRRTRHVGGTLCCDGVGGVTTGSESHDKDSVCDLYMVWECCRNQKRETEPPHEREAKKIDDR